MKIHHVLRSGIASTAMGLALLATPAFADDAAPKPAEASAETKDVIVVTGSITRNPAAATASPVTVLSADDLSKRGFTTVSDALQTLSANNAGTIGSNWSALGGFSTGAAAVSLRGFNDAFTLTVFNGLRMSTYPLPDDGYRGIVDLNTIPESIVERIDVLQDGASATYGSDAIAGVVNVVIKKEIQGLHINLSNGVSQHGDDGERRIDATWGIGKLSRDGYNLYINAEYQKNDPLFFSQRPGTFTASADRSHICGLANGNGAINGQTIAAGQPVCGNNGVLNGIQFNGNYNSFQATQVGFVQPIDPATGMPVVSASAPGGQVPFTLLNPAAGCQGLNAVNLTLAQQASPGAPATVCQQDVTKQYAQFLPDIKRIGANLKFTKNIGAAQAYFMVNFLETKTAQNSDGPFVSPQNFGTGQTTGAGSTPGGAPIAYANTFLPVYVCPQGTASINSSGAIVATGCNAANGKLNPNNPFAAQGQQALLYELMNRGGSESTDAKTYRISGGIDGVFGDGWTYSLAGTSSWINLQTAQYNYLNLQSFMNAVAQGTFNFVDQNANTAAQWNAIAPADINVDRSKLTQIQGTIGKDLFALPGGKANLAVGLAYRFESVNSPSANGPNETNPMDRYLSINAFAVSGSRRVWTGFYELSVPVTDTLKLKADGSYDSYTTNYNASYKRFSPKFEAQWRPVKQLKLRGTYSQGFAVPSFAEAGEILPAIGYVGTTINCGDPNFTAWCASHASNPAYYQNLELGTGSNSNANLKPQKSDSFTVGAVIQPTPAVTFTVDYWHTKISNYILPAAANLADVAQYYLNGTTAFADGTTILKGAPDPKNPNALPTVLAVLGSYSNAQSEVGAGLDFTATVRVPIGHAGTSLISAANASYLSKLEQTGASGAVQAYAGYLSPCNISSCSGAPKWRGSWQNTIDFNGKASTTLTAYYTSGYELVATDFGGTPGAGNCDSNTATGVPAAFLDGSTPVACKVHATFSLDWSGSVKVQDHFTLYANVLNVLNNKPPFDPSAQYAATQFNAAWASSNFIGRYFRIGAKIDF